MSKSSLRLQSTLSTGGGGVGGSGNGNARRQRLVAAVATILVLGKIGMQAVHARGIGNANVLWPRVFRCARQDGGTKRFTLKLSLRLVTIKKFAQPGSLCTLSLEQDDGTLVPMARSYNGHGWERAGGTKAARLSEWDCRDRLWGDYCSTSSLPGNGATYVLTTRVAPEFKLLKSGGLFPKQRPGNSPAAPTKTEVARFLESASFGATPSDLKTWNYDQSSSSSFAQYIRDQFALPPTFHREYFRRRANPRWTFHQPEFAAQNLDICGDTAERSTWRRQVLTVKDTGKTIKVRLVNGNRYWELSIDGHVRAVVSQLRFEMPIVGGTNDGNIRDGGSYRYCSKEEETYRGIYKLSVNGKCRAVVAQDLLIDFPDDYVTPFDFRILNGTVASLNNTQAWRRVSNRTTLDGYVALLPIDDKLCATLPIATTTIPPFPPPVFAKTIDGVWLQHDPRIDIHEGSLTQPWSDGGAAYWLSNKTSYCGNVPRSIFNEASCRMSSQLACRPGSNDKSSAAVGLMTCGSPGEVVNDVSIYGDSWLDVSSITVTRTSFKLPLDTTSREAFSRQRETIWTDVVLNAPDQLRQRMALALLHIFALPKTSITAEQQHTEYFLNYFDIFVRHAFGNYRDILREVSYNALMAESLTYLNSKAVAVLFARTNIVIFPDENYSRELMQLFTIGLVDLNMDGSPVLDDNQQTITTYNTGDIMSFARAWTGFERSPKRANIEATENLNRVDPMKIEAQFRDRFPKSDLMDGYIGDYYPLCEDLPAKAFLRIGAKYRLLGRSPLPELVKDDWKSAPLAKRLRLQRGNSGLYEKLCGVLSSGGSCTFPSLVVLDQNLACAATAATAPECNVDTVRVVQIDDVFYEYVQQPPCVDLAFFTNGQKVAVSSRGNQPMCANPLIPVAGEACCDALNASTPLCTYAGERLTRNAAQARCATAGKALCDYRNFNASAECPQLGYRWTSMACKMQVKVRDDGQIAIVHDLLNSPASVANTTLNYFIAYWKDVKFPNTTNSCGGGKCEQVDGACICDIGVAEPAVFTTLPSNAAEILEKLRVGHAAPNMYDAGEYTARNGMGYIYHSSTPTCCNSNTFFELTDSNGRKRFFRNVKSTVSVVGTTLEFRNPPMFNSLLSSEFSVADAQDETEAVLDHLFYHKNTPPFLAYQFIQRFGISNPSPRYILAVSTAFRDGTYTDGTTSFGSGNYGDLRATIAAVLLDREARSVVLENDPSHGALREPILKVMSVLRSLEYKSSVPLASLDLMDEKIGQMPYEQTSVFSFFRPNYSPVEIVSLGLAAPEAEVMSTGRIVGILNGLYSVIKYGLVQCADGFGVYGECSASNSSGLLSYQPIDAKKFADVVRDLAILLTSGRMDREKQGAIVAALAPESNNPTRALQLAMQLIVSTPEFHSTNRIDPVSPIKQSVPPPTTPSISQPGYKAVIHLALVGGCDSFNVLVPASSCSPVYQDYKLIRGQVALNTSDVLTLNGNQNTDTPQPCDTFTVHNRLPMVQTLYNDEDLLFLANVGVLTDPCNKNNCQVLTETQLFAHNTMQDEISSLDPFNVAAGTSPMGRMADVLQAKGYATGRTAVESTPASLAGQSVLAPATVTLDQNGVRPFNVNPSSQTMNKVIRQVNGESSTSKSGVYGEVWSSLLRRALNQTEDLVDLLDGKPTQTAFPDTTLGKRFKLVAQLVADRQKRGVNRDFFFVPFDGFDMHAEVTRSLQEKFTELNKALEALVAELKLLGVWDNVVILQTSDFGRTLTENTSGGTDHGWGGHYWMTGGSVQGRRIVGRYPVMINADGPLNWDRGRFIPTTPWDSVFNAVADWVGVTDESSLDAVLPNRRKFDNLFAARDLFSV